MQGADLVITFDDIGSFPPPSGVRIEQLDRVEYLELVRKTMELKLSCGVEAPTYPQFRDMVKMFMDPILDPETSDSPYLIKSDASGILELDALEMMANDPDRRTSFAGRVCVTGPIELYISVFGATGYTDILYNLAESVSRFLDSSMRRSFKVAVTSIDEPSLGISSNIIFSDDEMLKALEIASSPCRKRGVDCEVHLHSPLYAELCCRARGINTIGVESASHPDYLDLIDRQVLEDTDSNLRAGIARTDILSIVAGLNDRLGLNLWEDPAMLEREVMAQESQEIMLKRLGSAVKRFGERIRYAGPDCGLGSWPSQRIVQQLLRNCAGAISSFRREHR